VSAGIWSEPERFAQQPSCPSGNCKWEEYESTGWSWSCEDVTSSAKIIDCELDADKLDIERLNTTESCLVDLGHGNKFQVLGSYGYSENIRLSSQTLNVTTQNKSTIVKGAAWPLVLLNCNLDMPLDNGTYAGITNPIVALGNVYVQQCDESAVEKGLCVKFASECALSSSTRRFETSVVNGTTDTKSIEEDFGCLSQVYDDRVYYGGGNYITHCWRTGTPCEEPYFTDITDITPGQDPDFCSDGIGIQTADYDHWATYGNGTGPKPPHLQSELLARLTGNQSTDLLSILGFVHEGTNGMRSSSFLMEQIATVGLGAVLDGVAASLTQQALLANTSEVLLGTVFTTETYVAVDWPWLIYPATLVLGAILLLALTAMHSHRCGLRISKSSMLPLLYRTLDLDLRARQPVLHDVSAMTDVAGRAKVTLAGTSREDGLVLTQ